MQIFSFFKSYRCSCNIVQHRIRTKLSATILNNCFHNNDRICKRSRMKIGDKNQTYFAFFISFIHSKYNSFWSNKKPHFTREWKIAHKRWKPKSHSLPFMAFIPSHSHRDIVYAWNISLQVYLRAPTRYNLPASGLCKWATNNWRVCFALHSFACLISSSELNYVIVSTGFVRRKRRFFLFGREKKM